MTIHHKNTENNITDTAQWLSRLSMVPWLEVIAFAWKIGRKLWRGLADEGMYEVLDFHASLELLNTKGTRAHCQKHQKVRFVQNGIFAYQDQIWGDGDQLVNYQCSPGVERDRYRRDEKTFILISLRDTKHRGELEEFHIARDIHDGFVRKHEQWGVDISHQTKHCQLTLIFPANRQPKRIEQRTYLQGTKQVLHTNSINQLADGRWQVRWKVSKPRLNERYIFWWEW